MSTCTTNTNNQLTTTKQTVDFYLDEEEQLRQCFGAAKSMARQQLQVSEDSPFSQPAGQSTAELDAELDRVGAEKARLLREQSDELQRQLEFVRAKLGELNAQANEEADVSPQAEGEQQKESAQQQQQQTQKRFFADNQQVTSQDNQLNRKNIAPTGSHSRDATAESTTTRVRPLTGAADCPNCVCDRRRRSVCDKCAQVVTRKSQRLPSFINTRQITQPLKLPVASVQTTQLDYDERPIRPARSITPEVMQVDKIVVPNKVLTIGRSLDEKRTKLSQVIDELQVMMEKVRKRGERLEEERKVAQLYKQQWRFGPQLNGRPYASRLDPQLARDSNSLHNFRHVEPSLRLRQYAPKPKPRLSKVGGAAQVNRVSLHSRSRSLESLSSRRQVASARTSGVAPRISVRTTPPRNASVTNHSEPPLRSASSEVNLSTSGATGKDNDEEVEEAIEEELEEGGELEGNAEQQNGSQKQSTTPISEGNKAAGSQAQVSVGGGTGEPGTKKTWVPVFGETEIKTVRRAPVQRKVAVLSGGRGSITPTNSKPPPTPRPQSILRHRSHSAMGATTSAGRSRSTGSSRGPEDQVLSEASRKLHFASELLESERRTSSNQLIVRDRARRPEPIAQQSPEVRHPCGCCCATQPEVTRRLTPTRTPVVRCNQRRVINQDNGQQQVLNTKAKTTTTRSQQQSTGSRQLIVHLRERLNRTRAKLARTLEAERARHERHEQLARRKHSSLEQENELLKRSLSQCIDTCLRDLASAFESLNDTLIDEHQDDDTSDNESQLQSQSGEQTTAQLGNAAQLIADSRHLQRLRAHIEQVEGQKRAIYEELAGERQRAQQLEAELAARESSRRQDHSSPLNTTIESSKVAADEPRPSTSTGEPPPPPVGGGDHHDESSMSCSQRGLGPGELPPGASSSNSTADELPQLSSSSTFASLELYRQYIQSVTPDLDAIRRERRQILSEFDNIKRMLADMDNNGN